jgi:hypothetical protein
MKMECKTWIKSMNNRRLYVSAIDLDVSSCIANVFPKDLFVTSNVPVTNAETIAYFRKKE